MDVAALGEILIDFTSAGLSNSGHLLFEQNPGGAPANVLSAVTKLGGSAAFIGMAGKDQFGAYLQAVLKENKVDTTALRFTDLSPTTLAFVHLDARGERSFSFCRNPGADILLTVDAVDTSVIDACRIFHFGSLSLTDSPSREAALYAADYARKRGKLISYDPNYRPALWNDLKSAVHWMRKGLVYADIVKLSGEEMSLISDESDPAAGARILSHNGDKCIIITLGADGCYYLAGENSGYIPAYAVPVLDTTGAGDAFWGAFLFRLSHGLDPLSADRAAMENALRYASAAGALATTRRGAIPALPGHEEIMACIASNRLLFSKPATSEAD